VGPRPLQPSRCPVKLRRLIVTAKGTRRYSRVRLPTRVLATLLSYDDAESSRRALPLLGWMSGGSWLRDSPDSRSPIAKEERLGGYVHAARAAGVYWRRGGSSSSVTSATAAGPGLT